MTLHETTETMKKMGIGSAIGMSILIVLIITFNVGVLIKNILFPQKAEIANHTYGKLPIIVFPESATKANLVYRVNTVSGGFEAFPDRLNIYKLTAPAPDFSNKDKAVAKAKSLGFITDTGEAIPEIPIADATYEWDDPQGLQRKLIFNIVSFDFTLTSEYLTALSVLGATGLPDEQGAVKVTTDALDHMELLPPDIDITKSQVSDKKANYYTAPQLLGIQNGDLVPATSLSNAKVIRVDLYQKDLAYDLNTGLKGDNSIFQRKKVQLPVLYPKPPFSTMSFWVAVGPDGPAVVNAKFSHKGYIFETFKDPTLEPTYEIKSAADAFEELKQGSGYIASFNGSESDSEVLITNAYLAYYIGENPQSYLMPIYVFEGDKGFFGYVSAIKNNWVE